MGYFRLRRSIRLLPGVRLNLGKRSASVSIGGRGAHVTLGGPQSARTTLGIPGTGLSYTETAGSPEDGSDAGTGTQGGTPVPRRHSWLPWFMVVLLVVVVAVVLGRK